jgi:hypothetical protein
MKLKYTSIILSGTLLLSLASCKKELVKVNVNPNATQNPQPDYLLTGVIKNMADTYWGVEDNMGSSLLFVQNWSKIQYTDPDRYIFTNASFQGLWTTAYTKGVTNLNQIIKIADANDNSNVPDNMMDVYLSFMIIRI